MPKLWDETIDGHRRVVREAILDTTASLVLARGLRGVTMSEIAEAAGIGRATLYKYFPDVDAIMVAWHERQIAGHLQQLADLATQTSGAGEQLRSILEAYALIRHEHHKHGLAVVLHRGEHMAHAERQLRAFVGGLLEAAAASGEIRDDVAPDELASYCLNALASASSLPSKAAVRRLVTVTLDGLGHRIQAGQAATMTSRR